MVVGPAVVPTVVVVGPAVVPTVVVVGPAVVPTVVVGPPVVDIAVLEPTVVDVSVVVPPVLDTVSTVFIVLDDVNVLVPISTVVSAAEVVVVVPGMDPNQFLFQRRSPPFEVDCIGIPEMMIGTVMAAATRAVKIAATKQYIHQFLQQQLLSACLEMIRPSSLTPYPTDETRSYLVDAALSSYLSMMRCSE